MRRRPRGDESVFMGLLENFGNESAVADHVINILPENAESRSYFSASRFSLLKQAAVFYNIGRGTTVAQEALADVLDSGHLAAAWLDVTDPEPLAQGHSLWSAPHCYITPHTAGGHTFEAGSLVRHFLGNLRRFERSDHGGVISFLAKKTTAVINFVIFPSRIKGRLSILRWTRCARSVLAHS